jgi:hypothetical protein
MPEPSIRPSAGRGAAPDQALASGTPRAELYLVVDVPDAFQQRSLACGATELSPVMPRSWGHAAGYSLDPDGHVLAFAVVSGEHPH